MRLIPLASALLLPLSAQAQDLPGQSQLDCILEPNKSIEVSSPVEGVVETLYVERGDSISKGKPLLQLRAEVERASVELARARAAFGKRTVARNDELENLISDHEKDEIMTDAALARLELKEAETRLAMKTVYSPISGLVVDTLRSEGEYVSEEPVVMVVSIDPLYVEVIAPVEMFGQVQAGQGARVSLEYPLQGDFSAKVKTVDPVIDAASGTFRVRLLLPNPEGKIPSGLKCQVDFSAAQVADTEQ